MRKPRVLIVEDNNPWKNTITNLLRTENCDLEHVDNLEAAEILLSTRKRFDIVITNMILEEGSPLLGGLRVLDKVRDRRSVTRCIVLTEDRNFQTAVRIHNEYGEIVYAIIPKTNPWVDHKEFLEKFRVALAIVLDAKSAARKPPVSTPHVQGEELKRLVTEIKQYVQCNDLKNALNLLPGIGIKQNQVTQLERRLNLLQDRERKKTITRDDADTEYARIAEAILKLLPE